MRQQTAFCAHLGDLGGQHPVICARSGSSARPREAWTSASVCSALRDSMERQRAPVSVRSARQGNTCPEPGAQAQETASTAWLVKAQAHLAQLTKTPVGSAQLARLPPPMVPQGATTALQAGIPPRLAAVQPARNVLPGLGWTPLAAKPLAGASTASQEHFHLVPGVLQKQTAWQHHLRSAHRLRFKLQTAQPARRSKQTLPLPAPPTHALSPTAVMKRTVVRRKVRALLEAHVWICLRLKRGTRAAAMRATTVIH
jgi:hypothetical protein